MLAVTMLFLLIAALGILIADVAEERELRRRELEEKRRRAVRAADAVTRKGDPPCEQWTS